MGRPHPNLPTRALLAACGLLIGAVLAACAGGAGGEGGEDGKDGAATAPAGPLRVVAAENFWGSIAAQLGGEHVVVTSIIASPVADPHDYEPTPGDGRTIAQADYTIRNGLGYDSWAEQLLAANRSTTRRDVSVQAILDLPDDANPHRWYAPTDVARVIDRITADYQALDPAHAAAYERQRADFLASGLGAYHDLAGRIRERYAGTAVGATESIAAPLAEDLGLTLLTPESFLVAISEGQDPSARDRAAIEEQIAQRQIAVLLFNIQNATPDVQRVVDAARERGIPVVELTETPDPGSLRFQDWQTAQLQRLADALAAGGA